MLILHFGNVQPHYLINQLAPHYTHNHSAWCIMLESLGASLLAVASQLAPSLACWLTKHSGFKTPANLRSPTSSILTSFLMFSLASLCRKDTLYCLMKSFWVPPSSSSGLPNRQACAVNCCQTLGAFVGQNGRTVFGAPPCFLRAAVQLAANQLRCGCNLQSSLWHMSL